MKICSKCKIEKDESEYYKNARSKDGKETVCKECLYLLKNKDYLKRYYEANKHKCLARSKEWQKKKKIETGGEYEKNKKRRYKLKNSEKIRESSSYMLQLLNQNSFLLEKDDIPELLIEAKRNLLKLKRLIKNLQK